MEIGQLVDIQRQLLAAGQRQGRQLGEGFTTQRQQIEVGQAQALGTRFQARQGQQLGDHAGGAVDAGDQLFESPFALVLAGGL